MLSSAQRSYAHYQFVTRLRHLGLRHGRLLRVPLLLVLLAQISACATHTQLEPFTTDGCSLFPDGDLSNGQRWKHCCVQHDRAYWVGGSACERQQADKALQACVQRSTDSVVLGPLMYAGVRIGGTPWLPSWFRWGYGWPYGRGYQALSAADKAAVRFQLDAEMGSDAASTNGRAAMTINESIHDRVKP